MYHRYSNATHKIADFFGYIQTFLKIFLNETIVQAEIDSNHQFVRKKGCLTDKLLKINNLSVKRWVFTDKLLGVNQSFPVIPP